MEIILRVFQVFLAIGLIGVVLLQRSEGGGLGIGSSGGAGSFMSVRGTANFLTRVTAILAALFMITCLTLALLAKPNTAPKSIFDAPAPGAAIPAPVAPAPTTTIPPASEQLPVPVPGEGVTTTQPLAVTPPAAPAPAVETPAPVTAPAPAATAPTATGPATAAPESKPVAPAAKAKAKKAPQTGAAHTTGQ
jgi:preprotein translocase subunit SecG